MPSLQQLNDVQKRKALAQALLQSVGVQAPQPVAQMHPTPCDVSNLFANASAGRDGSEGGVEVEVDQRSLHYSGNTVVASRGGSTVSRESGMILDDGVFGGEEKLETMKNKIKMQLEGTEDEGTIQLETMMR